MNWRDVEALKWYVLTFGIWLATYRARYAIYDHFELKPPLFTPRTSAQMEEQDSQIELQIQQQREKLHLFFVETKFLNVVFFSSNIFHQNVSFLEFS